MNIAVICRINNSEYTSVFLFPDYRGHMSGIHEAVFNRCRDHCDNPSDVEILHTLISQAPINLYE